MIAVYVAYLGSWEPTQEVSSPDIIADFAVDADLTELRPARLASECSRPAACRKIPAETG
jgi:hypothetical protein